MGKLIPDTSVVTVYRRSLTPADVLISNDPQNPFPSLANKQVNVDEGEWVTLDAAGKAVKLGASPGAAGLLAFAVWVGKRSDAGAALQITVIFGAYIAKTSVFDFASGPYAAGDLLTAKLVAGASQLTKAASGDPVVAICEGPASGVTTDFPNGFLPYNTMNAGFIKP